MIILREDRQDILIDKIMPTANDSLKDCIEIRIPV